jgi:hypothetical protein
VWCIGQTGEITGVIDWDLCGSVPKHIFAAQLREHVQLLFRAPGDSDLGPMYTIYHDALAQLEAERKLSVPHRVTELYASPLTQMLAFSTKFVRTENCTDSRWARAYCEAVWGMTGWETKRDEEGFEEWYAALHPSLRALEE